jgi:phosphopantothenoylcysteine decarboxylase/phosphopantothenate--cysteine ligase
VVLVSTVDLPVPPGVTRIDVETADELQREVDARASADVIVMAAAVADFRPKLAVEGKLKKGDGVPEIILEPTPDILAALGARKRPGQVLVGFAAETDDLIANASGKLAAKRLDLIVANDVSAPGVGFGHDTNAVTLLRPGAEPTTVALTDKRAVAAAVIDAVVAILDAAGPQPTQPPS